MPPFIARVRALALPLIAACSASSASSPAAQAPPPPQVSIAVVELHDIDPSAELTGRVEAIHHVEIRARASGYVTATRYHEGAEVEVGAVLFTIDRRPYQAMLAHANADLARARARVALARLEAARAEQLLAGNAIPRAERDSLVSSSAQAEAEAQAAGATVDLAELDLEFTQVRAPIAGRSGRANVSVGDYVAAGPAPTTLTTVVSIDPIYVYFTCDEQTYLRFASHAEHSTVAVGLADETGFPRTGQVDFVDNRVDANTGTILVRAVVPNPDKRLAPGLFARVRLPEGKPMPAVLVDDKAILTDQDRKYVYVLGSDSTVERRDIKLGPIVDGRRVIAAGLKVGDHVIISGIQKVFPGSKATIATAPVQAASAATGVTP
ncbi:MAG: efflux transporter periplasmic adaptor subunit [Myxococcales bacterium]|nr:efflux transporter periplasmic adaptor subunit [Myxococcales bacterium]